MNVAHTQTKLQQKMSASINRDQSQNHGCFDNQKQYLFKQQTKQTDTTYVL